MMESVAADDTAPAVYIPVDSGEVISILHSELPEEVEDMIEILAAETAALHVWVQVAKAYVSQGKFKQGLKIMTEGSSNDVPEDIREKEPHARIQLCCEVANIKISQARALIDPKQRGILLLEATETINKARLLDETDQMVHISDAYLQFAQNKVKEAKAVLKEALKSNAALKANVAAMTALANILFQQKQFSEAHRYYCQALQMHPNAPPDVRLGLAQCLFRLGKFKMAELAYRRTLHFSPGCGPALLGMATISFYKSTEKGFREGMQYLCQAFDADPAQPAVLIMLARLCMNRNDPERARALALAAQRVAGTPEARAHATVLLARAEHALSNFKEAYTAYQQALEIDGTLPLPLFGMAQLMSNQAGGVDKALANLEKALDKAPFWPEALTTMGKLFPYAKARAGAGESAIAHFKEAAKADSSSSLVWEMLGEMLAPGDPAGALHAYRKALELKRSAAHKEREARRKKLQRARRVRASRFAEAHALENGDAAPQHLEDTAEQEQADRLEPLPAQLLNNAAVLHMRGGEAHAALGLIEEAVQSASASDYKGMPTGSQVTLGYNSARINEATGNFQAAATEYKNILEAFPEYTDCALRMACLAGRRGDYPEARQWIERAMKYRSGQRDGQSLQGWLCLEARDFAKADKAFEKLVSEVAKNDDYGWLGLASLTLTSIPSKRKKPEDMEKARKYAIRALDTYRQVLVKNEGNIYAANGIGAAIAELGDYNTAQKVFMMVQEAAAASEGFLHMPDAQLNMGILCLALEKPKEAVQIFSSVLRKYFRNTSAEVSLLLARAFYDADQMTQARRALLRAVHLNPTDMQLRFNVALVLQQHSVRTLKELKDREDDEKAADAQRAVAELHNAWSLFKALRKKTEVEKTGLDAKTVLIHFEFCQNTLKDAQKFLEQAEKESRVKEAKREVSRIQMEAEARKQELAREGAAQKRAAEAVRREEQARLALERNLELQRQWRESEALKQAAEQGDADKVGKKRKKSKGKAGEEELFEERAPADRAAALREAGLETESDDEDYNPDAEAADGDADKDEGPAADGEQDQDMEGLPAQNGVGGAGNPVSSPPPGGRLKKRARTEAAAGDGLEDMEDEPQVGLGLDDDDVAQEQGKEGASKSRMADLFGSSDEE